MTTKHTPTPWGFNVGKNGPMSSKIPTIRIYSDAAQDMVFDFEAAAGEQDEANAAFIVRACNSHYELLEACIEALKNLNERFGADSMNNLDFILIKKLTEAIANATKGDE